MTGILLLLVTAQAGDLTETLQGAVAVGGPTGHCPMPGEHEPRRYGSSWHPVGFSADGLLAYALYHESDMGQWWELRVQSLVTDKVLSTVSMERMEAGPPPTLAQFIQAKGAEVQAALTRHGIVVAPPTELGTFPLEHGGDTFTATVDKVRDDDELFNHRYDTRLVSAQHGSKRVDSQHARLDSELVGYLENPHEPRLAVLLAVDELGFEGVTKCVVHVVGASLTDGFPKHP